MSKPYLRHSRGYYILRKILLKEDEEEPIDLTYNEEKERWEVRKNEQERKTQ